MPTQNTPEEILEKYFPTPDGHQDTKPILAAMKEYASIQSRAAAEKAWTAGMRKGFGINGNEDKQNWLDENFPLPQ